MVKGRFDYFYPAENRWGFPPGVKIRKKGSGQFKKRRDRLFYEQGGVCYYCGRQMHDPYLRPLPRDLDPELRPTREHKIPRSRGGSNHDDNVVIACKGCNQAKGALTEDEFRTMIL